MKIDEHKIFSIQLKGALDGVSSEDLLKYLDSQIDAGYTRFLFNFTAVQFITSNGISTLLKIQSRLKAQTNSSFVFYGMSHEVESVLRLLGIYGKLPIRHSLVEAEAFLRAYHSEIKLPETEPVVSPRVQAESIKFYYSGAPKEPRVKSGAGSEAVSTLERIGDAETPSPMPTQSEVPAMEKLLEDKLLLLRQEIKETLTTELEKRLTFNKTVPTAKSEVAIENFPNYIQSKSKKSNEFTEKIFPCEACGTRLRVQKAGRHQCPNCKTEVFVNASGPTRFIEKFNLK
jgi:anti-anti-sigma factor